MKQMTCDCGNTFMSTHYALQEMAQTIRSGAEELQKFKMATEFWRSPEDDAADEEAESLLLYIADFADHCGVLLNHADYYLAGDSGAGSFVKRVKEVMETMKDE